MKKKGKMQRVLKPILTSQRGFTFQVFSDIHLEFLEKTPYPTTSLLEPASDVLFLAGDIGQPGRCNDALKDWLTSMAEHFKAVIYVPGNHEYYQTRKASRLSFSQVTEHLQHYEEAIENLFVLNPGAIEIGGVRVIGATLWSYVPRHARAEVEYRLNDYNLIYKEVGDAKLETICVADTVGWHEKELAFVTDELKIAKAKGQSALLCSHHAPILLKTSPSQYQGALGNETLHGFATDLMYLFRDHGRSKNSTLKWAIHGHTHHNHVGEYHGTMVYSNQRGYSGRHTGEAYEKKDVKAVH